MTRGTKLLLEISWEKRFALQHISSIRFLHDGRRQFGTAEAPADKEDSELNDIAYDEEKFVMNFTAYTEDSCWKTENLASGRRNPLAKYAVPTLSNLFTGLRINKYSVNLRNFLVLIILEQGYSMNGSAYHHTDRAFSGIRIWNSRRYYAAENVSCGQVYDKAGLLETFRHYLGIAYQKHLLICGNPMELISLLRAIRPIYDIT